MEHPQRLSDVQFKESRHGYDTAEVDAFVHQVADTVGHLQGQVRDLRERLRAAEARVAEAGRAEETLTRTLVLAQRTADSAVEEARAEAGSITTEAQERADRIARDAEYEAERRLREAESQATMLRAEAEREARRVVEATRQPLLEEIRDLEQVRNFLADDVALLEEHLELNRTRVRTAIEQLQLLVDSPDALRFAPTPALSGVSLGDRDDQVLNLFEQSDAASEHGRVTVDADTVEAEPVAEPEPAEPVGEPEPSGEFGAAQEATEADEFEALGDVEAAGDLELAGNAVVTGSVDEPGQDEDIVAAGLAREARRRQQLDGVDTGPPTEAMELIDLTDEPDESFVTELRRAVDDDPVDDPAFDAFFEDDVEPAPRRSRFGRRR